MTEKNNELDIEELLKGFRELVGNQAQEIVVLKSIISNIQKQLVNIDPESAE
jgi:hypothetical protein